LNPLRTLIPCFFKVHFIVIPSTLRSGKCSSCFSFSDYVSNLSMRCIICQLTPYFIIILILSLFYGVTVDSVDW
jgi:hypothetical protein